MSNQNGFDEVRRACVPLHVCLVCARALSSGVSAGESVFGVNDIFAHGLRVDMAGGKISHAV